MLSDAPWVDSARFSDRLASILDWGIGSPVGLSSHLPELAGRQVGAQCIAALSGSYPDIWNAHLSFAPEHGDPLRAHPFERAGVGLVYRSACGFARMDPVGAFDTVDPYGKALVLMTFGRNSRGSVG